MVLYELSNFSKFQSKQVQKALFTWVCGSQKGPSLFPNSKPRSLIAIWKTEDAGEARFPVGWCSQAAKERCWSKQGPVHTRVWTNCCRRWPVKGAPRAPVIYSGGHGGRLRSDMSCGQDEQPVCLWASWHRGKRKTREKGARAAKVGWPRRRWAQRPWRLVAAWMAGATVSGEARRSGDAQARVEAFCALNSARGRAVEVVCADGWRLDGGWVGTRKNQRKRRPALVS